MEKKRKAIKLERIEEVMMSDNTTGFCLACGEEAYGVEPDAERYRCESCKELEVFGAEQILLMGYAY